MRSWSHPAGAAALLTVLTVASSACVQPDFITNIELIVAPGQDPLAGASSVEVEVRYPNGEPITGSLAVSPGSQNIEGLRPGTDVVIEVVARTFDGDPVSLGRSMPLVIGEDGVDAAIFLGMTDSLARFPDALTSARAFSTIVPISHDRTMLVGGGDLAGSTIASIEILGIDSLDPLQASPLSILERIGHEAIWIPESATGETDEWQGKVAVLGGTTGSDDDTWAGGADEALDSVALIHPSTGVVELNVAFFEAGVLGAEVVFTEEGLLAAVGGLDDDGNHRTGVEMLLPGEALPIEGPTVAGRVLHQVTPLSIDGQQRFVFSGGLGAAGLVSNLEIWDGRQTSEPETPFGATLAVPRARHQTTVLSDGRLLITGGANGITDRADHGTSLSSAEIFFGDTGAVTPSIDSMEVPRQRHLALPIPGDRVLICGGVDTLGNALGSCEVYDAATDTFSGFLGGSMSPGGAGVSAASLPDGRIFFAGGSGSTGADDSIYVYTPPDWQD